MTYSKHGSFFCDCGAKEDGSCIALNPRQPQADEGKKKSDKAVHINNDARPKSSGQRKEEDSTENSSKLSSHQLELARQVASHRGQLLSAMEAADCVPALLDLAR